MNKFVIFFKNISLISIIIVFNSCGFHNIQKADNDWELIFEDNFDTFDNSKWRTLHDHGSRTIWSNKELEWYKDENVYSENGVLKLVAKKESIYGKDGEGEKQFDFTSGMICNSRSLTQTYGKWEMKVKFPFKKGYWPAFFIVPVKRPTLPEIDVFEYFGINKNEISCSHHWGIDYGLNAPDYNVRVKKLEGDFSDVWMIWAVEITPEKMVWKLNNEVVYTSKQGLPTSPLYMIANVAIKDRPESGITIEQIERESMGNPYIMEIDYVKIYKMVSN